MDFSWLAEPHTWIGFATLIAYYRQSQKKPYKYSPEALLILGNPECAMVANPFKP